MACLQKISTIKSVDAPERRKGLIHQYILEFVLKKGPKKSLHSIHDVSLNPTVRTGVLAMMNPTESEESCASQS